MQSIQNALLTSIQKEVYLTAMDAVRLAKRGAICNVTRMYERGYVALHGIEIKQDTAGRKRNMHIYKITAKGIELLERKTFTKAAQPPPLKVITEAPSKRTIETYTPRQRDPGEALGVQFAPMFQPAYVPPRWESVR